MPNRRLYFVMLLYLSALLSGCASRSAGGYRLIVAAGHPLLLPPRVASPAPVRRVFQSTLVGGTGKCPQSGPVMVKIHGKRIQVVVQGVELAAQPQGWLRQWIGTIEAAGCIPQGSGMQLATEVVESIALDPGVAFRLLHDNLADVAAGTRIQVRGPVMREGAAADAPLFVAQETSEVAGGLNLALKSTRDFLGTETDVYDVRARPDGVGVQVTATAAERNVKGERQTLADPARNYFNFAPGASFFRLYYKASENGSTALIVAAPNYAELDQKMAVLDSRGAVCENVGVEWCTAIPKLVAVNIVLPVKVNGGEVFVRYGATIEEVIRGTGERRPAALLPQLHVSRTYRGQPVEVQFDRASSAILSIPVWGGESIAWK